MGKEILSITDENSILITAEFLEIGKILKVGDREVERFEIDLIVKDTITFDELLIAIQSGLRFRLLDRFHFDVDRDDTQLFYTDSRHPEAEMPVAAMTDEQILKDVLSKPGRFNIIGKWKIRKFLRQSKKFQQEYEEREPRQSDESDVACIDSKSSEEKLKCAYITCWNVFQECFDKYNFDFRKHTESTEIDRIKYGTPREPVIGLGSVNYNMIPYGRKLHESDIFKICIKKELGQFTLKELGFMTTSRVVFDPIGWHHSAALFDKEYPIIEAFKDKVPLYNISERPLRRLDDEPLHIIPPTDMPTKGKQSLVTVILMPLLMTAAMVGIRLVTMQNSEISASGGMSFGLMTGGMGIITAFAAVVNWLVRKKEYKESVEKWREQYQTYIRHILSEIKIKQREDIEKLRKLFPPARDESGSEGEGDDLVSRALSIHGDIFSHGQEHPNFLDVRIGISTARSELVSSVFEILSEKKEAIFASVKYHNILDEQFPFGILLPNESLSLHHEDGTSGDLINLPDDISNRYKYLEGAPVILNLSECETLGIVMEEGNDDEYLLSNILLSLCFYHSPDDLQIVWFCKETKDWYVQQEAIRRYKYLPHFRELLGDLSPFAFNQEDAYLIFNKLLEILSERKEGKAGSKYPHILVIVQEEYEIKRHPVAEYFPTYSEDDERKRFGISFIFCKRYMEELPRYCGKIIKKDISDGDEKWYLLPHKQLIRRNTNIPTILDQSRYCFQPDAFPPVLKELSNQEDRDRYVRAFKSISALHYERIAQGTDVPDYVDLLDLIESDRGIKFDPEQDLGQQLSRYVQSSWGIEESEGKIHSHPKHDVTKSLSVPIGLKGGGIVELDLHEDYDGPHMLVAGTTGSGKTETVLTMLINLCSIYTPEQVNLLLMDMKGAGFVQRIGQDENKLPHVVGTVTDISGDETGAGMAYMLKRFLHSMDAEVKRRKVLLSKMDVDNVDGYTQARKNLPDHISKHEKLRGKEEELKTYPPLPHLFLVIDEFTELMKFSSENGDVDFKKSITSLARIGRSLGFHIILISQNIENAITPDIRVNSRARLCLRVATREASKEMIGTDAAASALMPGNGRAYLLIGNGSRFDYFQSGYSKADITRNRDEAIVLTYAETSGRYSLFYDSKKFQEKENELAKQKNTKDRVPQDENTKVDAEGTETQSRYEEKKQKGVSQLKALVDQIRVCDQYCRSKGLWKEVHCVFQQPLPAACYYEYNWETGGGECIILTTAGEGQHKDDG